MRTTLLTFLLCAAPLYACCGKGPDQVDTTPAAGDEVRWGYIRIANTGGTTMVVDSFTTNVNFRWNDTKPFALQDVIVRVRVYLDGPGDGNGQFDNATTDPLISDIDSTTLGLPVTSGMGGMFQQQLFVTFPLSTSVTVPAGGANPRGLWIRLQIAAAGQAYQDARDVQVEIVSMSATATTTFGLSAGSATSVDLQERIFYITTFGIMQTVACPGHCPGPGADCALRPGAGGSLRLLCALGLLAAGVSAAHRVRRRHPHTRSVQHAVAVL